MKTITRTLKAALLTLFIASTTFATTRPPGPRRILHIGDSQSAGPFGARLVTRLRSDFGHSRIYSFSVVGSSVETWNTGNDLRRRGEFTTRWPAEVAPERLGTLEELREEHVPSTVIVQLGGNMLGNLMTEPQVAEAIRVPAHGALRRHRLENRVKRQISRMAQKIRNSHAACVWIGPPNGRACQYNADGEKIERVAPPGFRGRVPQYCRDAAQMEAFYRMAAEALNGKCHFVDSRRYTEYPEIDDNGDGLTDGDGVHYNIDALRPRATNWANSAFDDFRSLVR